MPLFFVRTVLDPGIFKNSKIIVLTNSFDLSILREAGIVLLLSCFLPAAKDVYQPQTSRSFSRKPMRVFWMPLNHIAYVYYRQTTDREAS